MCVCLLIPENSSHLRIKLYQYGGLKSIRPSLSLAGDVGCDRDPNIFSKGSDSKPTEDNPHTFTYFNEFWIRARITSLHQFSSGPRWLGGESQHHRWDLYLKHRSESQDSWVVFLALLQSTLDKSFNHSVLLFPNLKSVYHMKITHAGGLTLLCAYDTRDVWTMIL